MDGIVVAPTDALEEVLRDQLRVLGPDHPDTQASDRSLARWGEQTAREARR